MKPAEDQNIVRTLEGEVISPAVEKASLTPTPSTKPKFKIPMKPILTTISTVVVILGIAVGVLYLVVGGPVRSIIASTQDLKATAASASEAMKSQDLAAMQAKLSEIEIKLGTLRKNYSKLGWVKLVPVVGSYYKDGELGMSAGEDLLQAGDIAIKAITPYADVIGLKGLKTTGDGNQTAQDRINFLVETLDKVKPELGNIGSKLAEAQKKVDQINPNRYPEEVRGMAVRSQVLAAKTLLSQISSVVNDAKPLLEVAPAMLGKDRPIKYLAIFQNDAELRPTGGFMTGYAVIEVNKGKISVIEADDIYKLDERFPKKIPAPEPIKKYHPNVPYWYLRDQNLSPDFRVSMETFMPNYAQTKSPAVDGVIAVDTQFLINLLKVTGTVGVPGYGNFKADIDPKCDCPNVFLELQILAGDAEAVVWDSVSGKIVKQPANYGQRKKFLGPVMYSIMANVMAQPKAKIPDLASAVLTSIAAKHVQFYFPDETRESAVESFNMAGRVKEYDGDYLMVVDTNFSGGKTNIWVKYDADVKVDISSDGTVTKTVELTYNNPQGGSVQIESGRKLNGLFRNWLRVYVPKGSELIEAKGFESGQATGEDLGKTVFEGFFTLAPLNTKKITLKYKLPFKVKSTYKSLVQKQGGTKDFPYVFKVNGKTKPEVILSSDREFVYSF